MQSQSPTMQDAPVPLPVKAACWAHATAIIVALEIGSAGALFGVWFGLLDFSWGGDLAGSPVPVPASPRWISATFWGAGFGGVGAGVGLILGWLLGAIIMCAAGCVEFAKRATDFSRPSSVKEQP